MLAGPALGEERRLIFENVANGVPVETVMVAFQKSRLEIDQAVAFVAKKITEYRFKRCAEGSRFARPIVPCGTYADIRMHRKDLLGTLSKLGNLYLSSPLLIPKVNLQKVDSQDAVREVSHRMSHA